MECAIKHHFEHLPKWEKSEYISYYKLIQSYMHILYMHIYAHTNT